ncbi:MAG: FHA domain-containing protein [Prosthecobacter sp.]
MPKLIFIFEDGQEITVPLADRITIGNTEQNDVFVDDERISQLHAELLLNADGSVQVFDLNSLTGTFVNGQRVVSHTLLDGDKLAFGPLHAVLDLELPSQPATQAETRCVPGSLPPPAENEPEQLDSVTRQAEATQREWLVAIEQLAREHQEKSAALVSLQHELDGLASQKAEAAAKLEKILSQLREEQGMLAEIRREQMELASTCELTQKHLHEGESKLAQVRAQLVEMASMEQKMASLNDSIAEAEKCRRAHESAITGLQHEQTHQQAALLKVENSLAETQEALASCRADLVTGKQQLEEIRALRAGHEAANQAPLDELHRRIDRARGELATLEARLRPLREWKDSLVRRQAQLSLLPPHSPEARDLLREIESDSAQLLHIINTPPSRTPRIVQVEPPCFTGVPLKSGHVRLQAGTVSKVGDRV